MEKRIFTVLFFFPSSRTRSGISFEDKTKSLSLHTAREILNQA